MRKTPKTRIKGKLQTQISIARNPTWRVRLRYDPTKGANARETASPPGVPSRFGDPRVRRRCQLRAARKPDRFGCRTGSRHADDAPSMGDRPLVHVPEIP